MESDQIYRVFGFQKEIELLLLKSWKGDGVHALPTCPVDSGMRLRLQLKKGELKITLQSKQSFWKKMSKMASSDSVFAYPQQSHLKKTIVVSQDSLEFIVDADFVIIKANHLELKLQALDLKKMHCSLFLHSQFLSNDLSNKDACMRMVFSGAIQRG